MHSKIACDQGPRRHSQMVCAKFGERGRFRWEPAVNLTPPSSSQRSCRHVPVAWQIASEIDQRSAQFYSDDALLGAAAGRGLGHEPRSRAPGRPARTERRRSAHWLRGDRKTKGIVRVDERPRVNAATRAAAPAVTATALKGREPTPARAAPVAQSVLARVPAPENRPPRGPADPRLSQCEFAVGWRQTAFRRHVGAGEASYIVARKARRYRG